MALIQRYYKCKDRTKSKLAGEGSYTNRYRNYYRAAYPGTSQGRYKERAVYSIAAYRRRKLS